MNKKTVRDGSVDGVVESEVKFAGNDNKVKMYEPKNKRKLLRVLTVIAYLLSVGLTAIILSLFYVFIYSPGKSSAATDSTAQKQFQTIKEDSSNAIKDTNPSLIKENSQMLPI